MAIDNTTSGIPAHVQKNRTTSSRSDNASRTEYSGEGDVNEVSDDTPAAEQWKFLQSTDEMSAAFTQFFNRRMYDKKTSEVSSSYEYVLDDEVMEKADRILEALKNSNSDSQGLLNFARRLFPDDSDLILVLREFLRRKEIDEIIKSKVRLLLQEVEKNSNQKYIKAGINCALKAKMFGKAIAMSPRMLRASYRAFLMSDESAVDTYVDWIGSYGFEKREPVLEFIESSLLSDINALDASCSSVEFGFFLRKICELQTLRSAELLFIRYVTKNRAVQMFKVTEDVWLLFLMSLFKNPDAIDKLLEETLDKHIQHSTGRERAGLLLAIYQGCKNLPHALFPEVASLSNVLVCLKEALARVYRFEIFESQSSQDLGSNIKGMNDYV